VINLLYSKLDYIFKNIFGIEKNKASLISFLNALLKSAPPIKDLSFDNTDIAKLLGEDKASRLDVKAVCDDGTQIDIEIQCRRTGDISQRAFFYLSRMVPRAFVEATGFAVEEIESLRK
jgi:predicted transposase/invertase (TIGR01784 family)